MPPAWNSVTLTVEGGVAELALNRPDKRNALDESAVREVRAALDAAGGSGARAFLLRGEGKAFCAGRDLSGAEPAAEDAERILSGLFNPLLEAVADIPVPTFAVVHGPALGVGLGLALACDVVFAAPEAKLGSPFAQLGCVLDSGGHKFFVDRLGPHRALELIYTGRLLNGTEAADWGLVNRCLPTESLLDEVRSMAATVAAGPTKAFVLSKELVQRIDAEGLGLRAVMAAEATAQGRAQKTHDYAEGIGAFLDRRCPDFTGQ